MNNLKNKWVKKKFSIETIPVQMQWLDEWNLTTTCNDQLLPLLNHVITASLNLTSCLLASKASKLTKQLICNRKSIKTAKAAKRENVLTAGMLDKAPAEQKKQSFLPQVSHYTSNLLYE